MISTEFFECVTLPALKELRLEFVTQEYFPHAEFNSMHERSGFVLEKFTICRADLGSPRLARDLLGRMPCLVSFETEENSKCHAAIRRALIYNSKRPLLPLLQEIRFLGDPPRSTFAESFVNVVTSRWWPDATQDDGHIKPLQRLTSAYLALRGRKMDDTIKRRLIGLREEGLELEIVEILDTLVSEEDLHGDGSSSEEEGRLDDEDDDEDSGSNANKKVGL